MGGIGGVVPHFAHADIAAPSATRPSAAHTGPVDAADEVVVEQLVERIRQQVLQEIAEEKTADPRV